MLIPWLGPMGGAACPSAQHPLPAASFLLTKLFPFLLILNPRGSKTTITKRKARALKRTFAHTGGLLPEDLRVFGGGPSGVRKKGRVSLDLG